MFPIMRVASVLWCACVMCGLATTTRAQQMKAPAALPPTIIVIPTVIAQKYCRGHDNEYPIHLRLRFAFRNVSKKTAIVYLGSPTVARVMIAADMNGFRSGNFESDMSVSSYRSSSEIDERFLVAIKAGEEHEYEYEGVVAVIVSEGTQVVPGLVSAGAHLMRVTLAVWPSDDERAARQWVQRLSKRGSLELGPLVTEPTSLQISAKPTFQACDEGQ